MSWFRRKKADLAEQPPWLQIVQAYGAVLSDPSMGVGGSRAESDLPYSKGLIKAALKEAARQEGIHPDLRETLGVGFVQLAIFQPDGGGNSPLHGEGRLPQPQSEAEIRELARVVSESSDEEMRLSSVVSSEMDALLTEWNIEVGKNA